MSAKRKRPIQKAGLIPNQNQSGILSTYLTQIKSNLNAPKPHASVRPTPQRQAQQLAGAKSRNSQVNSFLAPKQWNTAGGSYSNAQASSSFTGQVNFTPGFQR